MVVSVGALIVNFIVSWIVSTVIIYVVVKLFGEEEGLGTALLAALAGSFIYAGAYYFLNHGLAAAVIGGFAWLLALGGLYKVGWGKALLMAVVIWVAASVVSLVLPTLTGPL